MGKKSKNKNKKISIEKRNSYELLDGIAVQKIKANSLSIRLEDVEQCPCYRKGYCKLRDDKCLPKSLKCIKNKKTFEMATFTPTNTGKTDSIKKTFRNTKNYDPYISERYGNNKEIQTEKIYYEKARLYVFKGYLNLSKQHTTDYYLIINDIRSGKQYKILVAFNSKTNRYYISDTQLQWLHKRMIFPDVIFIACNEGTEPLITMDFNDMSVLALYGYSAGKSGLDTDSRRKILRYVLDNEILKKYKVIEHLQSNIHLRENREDADFTVAISNWREDIKYVNDYKIK